MQSFFGQQIIFYISIAFVLFLPGFALLRAIWGRRDFSALETFVLSFGLSIVVLDGLMLLLDRLSIPLTRWSLIIGIGALVVVLFLVFRKRFHATASFADTSSLLSKRQAIIVGLLLLLTVGIKTFYLSNNILPTSTDLGHHMYWSQTIVDEHRLPVYEKQDIEQQDGQYLIGEASPISDFIVGEHLIISGLALVSGSSLISAQPILILYLIDLIGLLAIFILVQRAFQGSPLGPSAALLALGILGPLYAISAPQAQYVAGGVVGNLIGNLLIPLIAYFLIRGLTETRSGFISVGFCLIGSLLYTHHLTSYLFLYLLVFTMLAFVILNFRGLRATLNEWKKLLFAPDVLITIGVLVMFFLVIHTPSYISNGAVTTVARAPTKTTRAGLSFSELASSFGSARLALGLFGIVLLAFYKKWNRYASALLLGWTISILLILLWPNWLRIDIPTIRIANYFTFPISIMCAVTLTYLLYLIRAQWSERRMVFSYRLLFIFVAIITGYLVTNGIQDTVNSNKNSRNYIQAAQTYNASEYLAARTTLEDGVLKDHNYLTADSWIKLFFMRGYNYPLTRGYFWRYSDTAEPRAPCPLWMISTPDSPDAVKCYRETDTDYVMINPKFDSEKFTTSPAFWNIYSADSIAIFYRNNDFGPQ